MSTISWDRLNTEAQCTAVLDAILADAKSAADANDADKLMKDCALLDKFLEKCPTDYPDLRKLASDTAQDIRLNAAAQLVASIKARNDELAGLIQNIGGITATNKKAAKALLSIADLADKLGKVKGAIEAVKDAQSKLESPDAGLTAKLDALSTALEAVAAVIEPKKEEKKDDKGTS